jgi:hypothetical protein
LEKNFIGIEKVLCSVLPLMLKAAIPVGATRMIGELRPLSPANVLRVLVIAEMRNDSPVPVVPSILILNGRGF